MRKALICRIPDIDQARTSSLWDKYAESYLILVDFLRQTSFYNPITQPQTPGSSLTKAEMRIRE